MVICVQISRGTNISLDGGLTFRRLANFIKWLEFRERHESMITDLKHVQQPLWFLRYVTELIGLAIHAQNVRPKGISIWTQT